MRQVPLKKPFFALVGRGRVGRALAAYLEARELPFRVFTRDLGLPALGSPEFPFTSILLAISDSALAEVSGLLSGSGLPIAHFSGSVRCEGATAFHPLFSFTGRELSPSEFESIPFVTDPGQAAAFAKIFPDFRNPVFELLRPRDSLYHALCVLLGNLPTVIEDRAATLLENDFGLPRQACLPYLKALLQNFSAARPGSPSLVAGPVARRDLQMTKAHLNAVGHDPFLEKLYLLLVHQAWPEYPGRKSDEEHP